MPMWRHVVARARRPTERRRAVVPNIPKKKSHPLCTAHGAYPLFAEAYVLRPLSKWKELERCYGQIAQFATGRNDVKLTTIILKSTAEDELFTKNLVEDFYYMRLRLSAENSPMMKQRRNKEEGRWATLHTIVWSYRQ